MRKVIVSMNVTLDGFISGPNGELDWHFQSWNDEMGQSLCEQLGQADTILMGRVTYQVMSRYWPTVAMSVSYPREDIAFADMMNKYSKVVFSKTLQKAEWNNTRVVGKNISREIMQLKQQPGKDIMIYGSGVLVSSLIRLHLIDEFILWVHPVALGSGKPLFRNLKETMPMELLKTKTFSSGLIILYYEVVN